MPGPQGPARPPPLPPPPPPPPPPPAPPPPPRHDGEPCDRCATCQAITAGSSLDVQELDAASHNSVENIREIRVQVTMVAAGPSAHRVFILDEAHMLSTAACNALLKTLEEPPPNVHFILATTEPYKLLDTIRSRSQRFDFHPVAAETLTRHLRWVSEQEGYEVGEGGLEAIARHAGGSVRDSLSLLEQVAALGEGRVNTEGVERALGVAGRETMTVLARAVVDRDAPAVLSLVARLDSRGVNLRSFISDGIGFFRGAYLAHHLPDPAAVSEEPSEVIEDWKETAKIMPVADVNRVIDQLGEALIKIREGREERLMLEMALLWIVRPETSIHPAALLNRIEALEARINQGGALAAPIGTPPAVSSSPSAPARAATTDVAEPAVVPRPTAPSREPSVSAPPQSSQAPTAGPPSVTSPSDSGPLSLDRLLDLWTELVATFTGMDAALLRPTNPVALEGERLAVDCSVTFRRDRLQERNAASRLSDEIERRTSHRIRVDFVVQDRDGVSLSAPAAGPSDSSPVPPPEPTTGRQQPQAPRSDPRPEDDERPFEPQESDVGVEAKDSGEADAPDEEPGADLEAFFEAADISVTEVKQPSGPSLF
ncbi:MAG: DNA polymerase III subunit gamma/tau [Acidimicrobiia bacterium]|nr:DNA polymerase III subunit gamma/tau [Acidimicrobiia bacterium]